MEVKKSPNKNLETKRGMFFFLGISIALGMSISAFEWKSKDWSPVLFGELNENIFDSMPIVPMTIHKKPPKPIVEIIEVTNDIEIEEIEIDVDLEVPEEVIEIPFVDQEDDEVIEEIILRPEIMPSPIEGLNSFYQYLGKNIRYPAQARRMGIEGRVYIQFVVGKDGSLTQIEVVKGIGAGCDAEAERVLRMSPKWNAGKQNGRAVKVRMVVPVTFNLN